MKSETFKGAFVLATYQRPEILSTVLQAIYGADNSSNYNKVIIFQGNDEKSLEIINHFKDEATILVRVSGKDRSPLENITNNYLMGLEIAFEYLAVDYVIEVEDDSVIAPHTLEFIDQIFSHLAFHSIKVFTFLCQLNCEIMTARSDEVHLLSLGD